MHNLILTPVSVEELTEKIALRTLELLGCKNEQTEKANDLMTRKEVCDLLSINFSTLWKHTKSGKLKSFGLGNRVFYSREQVLQAVKPLNF
ncbi:helix-turn-helix domain-containing protein [Flavobacterium sp. F-328]|uniref:Helix-turn-helix domain-containing protein n=1 Tax=Flavobacterium erciyesense TaxID=2825842 RepID=A0ABS5D3N3_9FLAO|nr:helix-turn-helix domain-containing protein [Flavobacterium erciyesense]MBQ0908596.1 helix-turn-helix domain-containing protein [Flavobacterium erciyesense]